MPSSTRASGQRGESAAARFLLDQGAEIIARNYRCRQGEIDIIARQDGVTLFVEVKARGASAFGAGAHAVGRRKQRSLIQVAERYAADRSLLASPLRFDVIEVDLSGQRAPVWYQAAFEADR